MQLKQVDLFIIGGGINGVGIAADAAGRGLSVLLCEKDDLASHASSASTQLIHGGLRYLEQYDFKLVRNALHEREILLRSAPHLIHPLEFLLPHDRHSRPMWMIRLGLLFYDYLSRRKILQRSRYVDFTKDIRARVLQDRLRRGFSYMDCQTDDARLVVTNALQAQRHGASILTQREVMKLELLENGWQITIKNKKTQHTETIMSKAVVNAAGAWVIDVLKNRANLKPIGDIRWIKGSHFVVPKLYDGNFAFLLQNCDQRVVFIIPYQHHYSLIGTTDLVYEGDPNDVKISLEERKYLIDIVNGYLKTPIHVRDIIWSYSGIRSLYAESKQADPSKITRDYHLELTEKNGCPLLSVLGGKLTTYRHLAEEVLTRLRPYFPEMGEAWTHKAVLPGGDLQGMNFIDFFQQLKKKHAELPQCLLQRLAKNYGSLCDEILMNVTTIRDLGMAFSADLYEIEVKYLLKNEWATCCDDIIWRRTKLGIHMKPKEINQLTDYCHRYFTL